MIAGDAGKNEGSLCSAALPQSHEQMPEKESGNLTAADKPTPHSPDVVKTIVVSRDTNGKDNIKGPSTKNVEVPEAKGRLIGNALSGSQFPIGNSVSESETVLTFESSSLVDLPKKDSGIAVAPAANASLVILFLHVISAIKIFSLHIIFLFTGEHIYFSVHVLFFILWIIFLEGCGGTPIIFWPIHNGHQVCSGYFA